MSFFGGKMKNGRGFRASLALVLFFGLALTLPGCSRSVKEEKPVVQLPPCKARIIRVDAQAADDVVVLSGVTEPIRRVTPATRLMAKVVQADFSEGDRVKTGQTLVRLDVSDLEAKRRQVLAAVEAAETAYQIAEANLQRLRELAASGSMPQTNLEQMQLNHAQAAAARVTAVSALAELDTNLSYATISAPFDGVIVQRLVEVGNTVAPGQPLLIVEDDSQLRVVASVGAENASRLVPGQQVRVRIDNSAVDGVIEAIVSSGSGQAPGLRMNVLVDNAKQLRKTGTLAVVEAPLGENQVSPVVIPRPALVSRGNLNGVFTVDEDHLARLRWLVIEEGDGEQVSVITGLREGERVVLAPDQMCVRDGRRVEESE